MGIIVDFLSMLVFCLGGVLLLELALITGAIFIPVMWVKVIFISLAVFGIFGMIMLFIDLK